MRLRYRARPLRRLVEIRGREHLEAALAGGKGAILCSAHFGSYDCAFSLLGASGFPVTTIGRWQHNYTAGLSSAERRFWDLVYARRLRRHRQRPNIEPWTGRVAVAAQAAAVLRANEVLTISIDAPPLEKDLARTVQVPFLGRRARLLPGAVTLARLTGAPLLMSFMYRTADYRHQVLEISAPVQCPAEEDAATAFARCAAEVSAAIRRSPAHWVYWASNGDLANLGLLSPDTDEGPAMASIDLSPLRAPSVYDFPDRNDRLSAHLSDSVNVRSVYQMYSIGFPGLSSRITRRLIPPRRAWPVTGPSARPPGSGSAP